MKPSDENLLDIALIFERANGNALDDNDSLSVEKSGLTEYSPEELESMLIASLGDAEPEYRSTSYWALGKRYNIELVPLFNKWLESEVQRKEHDSIYQILIALDNLEIPVFGEDREGSYSSMDIELNLRDARVHLSKNDPAHQ